MPTKVLFLNPPFFPKYSRQSRSPCVTKGGTLYYPYYLAYGAGASEQAGLNVKLVDAIAADMNREDTIKLAKEFNPNLIVMDTSTPSIINDVQVAGLLKEALPNSHLTLCNTHPTNFPEQTFKMAPTIDSVARGEIDYTIRDLAFALESGKDLSTILGISYHSNGRIVHNAPRPQIEDLDALPFVSAVYHKHLGEALIKKYFYASICWPYIQILTARGCPYVCSFCNIPEKRSYRPRSVKNVIEEFEFIQNEMPYVNEIFVEDDTFPVSAQRTNELCDALVKNNIKVRWSCNARVNMESETMQKMRQAGCRLMCVGFESPTQDALNGVVKGTTQDMQFTFMDKARSADLLVNGCFILGLPHDNPTSMQRTIDFAKELNPNSAQFYPLMIYPGTAAWAWAEKNSFISTKDWNSWLTTDGLHNTVVSRPELSNAELLRWCNKARLEYYTSRKFLGKMLIQAITNPREGVRIAKASSVLFKHLAKYVTSNQAKVARPVAADLKVAPVNA